MDGWIDYIQFVGIIIIFYLFTKPLNCCLGFGVCSMHTVMLTLLPNKMYLILICLTILFL